jgi:hypothetical protein
VRGNSSARAEPSGMIAASTNGGDMRRGARVEELDPKWGQGFLKADPFVSILYKDAARAAGK